MKKNALKIAALLLAAGLLFNSCKKEQDTITVGFDSMNLGENGYINDQAVTIADIAFTNDYNQEYFSFTGFAFSSLNDVETEGYANQYSVYNAKNNGNQFAVAYDGGEYGPVAFEFTDGAARKIKSFEVCNNTYAALSTKNGDAYAKKFEDGDYFAANIIGYDKDGNETGKVTYYLVDYRNGKSVILDSWKKVDLTSLGKVTKIQISLESTDNGEWGMNTPAYICIDNIIYVD